MEKKQEKFKLQVTFQDLPGAGAVKHPEITDFVQYE
jgi:hypothetical protein